MKKTATLVTGALGEMGHALLSKLSDERIIALDIREPEEPLPDSVTFHLGSVTDAPLLHQLEGEFHFTKIFHLAGLLSSGAEERPFVAHDVNVNGSVSLLELALRQSKESGSKTLFIFPSTIATYGIRERVTKLTAGKIAEGEFLEPTSMYGTNKLYIERLGAYFSNASQESVGRIDFRSIRFPGILSADTVPTTGTSDYGPLMLHAAAKGEPYSCFVSEDATLNFVVMPDAIRALLLLAAADESALTRRVYNITSFSLSAREIEAEVSQYFPESRVHYEPVQWRDAMVDSWPADTDDSCARADWEWMPEYDVKRAFADYLVPGVRARYGLQ